MFDSSWRLFPRGLSGRAARSGPSHHARVQQNQRCSLAATDQGGPVTVSFPPFHVWCLHPGHSEPTATSAGAQFHLHFPQHSTVCGAGEGEEAEGRVLNHWWNTIKKRTTDWFFTRCSSFVLLRSTWGWWASATGSTGAPGSSCSSSFSQYLSCLSLCCSVSRWVSHVATFHHSLCFSTFWNSPKVTRYYHLQYLHSNCITYTRVSIWLALTFVCFLHSKCVYVNHNWINLTLICRLRWSLTEQCCPTVTPRWSLFSCWSSPWLQSTSASWSVPSSPEVREPCCSSASPVISSEPAAVCALTCVLYSAREIKYVKLWAG